MYGHAYTLDYRATVPAWHYEGVVAVPEASTWGMMLAGLGLVGVAARRRKRA